MNNIFSVLGTLFIGFAVLLLLLDPQSPKKQETQTIKPWPPSIDKTFPDLSLIDQNGRSFRLSEYKGKVIILEMTATNSAVCQAYAGSERAGIFENVPIQKGIEPIMSTLHKYEKGIIFPNKDVVFIQIIFYGQNFREPVPVDAANWAKHFGFKVAENQIVAVGTSDMRSEQTYKLVEGFQLIDRNFVLKADISESRSQNDLQNSFLPMVPIAIYGKKR